MSIINTEILNIWFNARNSIAGLKNRALRNLCYYAPLNPYDVHDPAMVAKLRELGLDTEILNYTNEFVQKWAGLLNQQKSSPIWTDKENDKIDTSSVIQGLMTAFDSDRYLYSYDKAITDFIVNAMIFMGVSEFVIDKHPQEPLGRILLKNHPIGTVWFDHELRGTDMAKESRYAYKEYQLTTNELIYNFPHKKEEILYHEKQFLAEGGEGHELPDATRDKGSKIAVVEFNYIERSKKRRTYTKSGIRLPKNNYENGSQDEKIQNQAWLKTQGYSNDTELVDRFEPIEVLKTYIFSPTLAIQLEDRVDQRQIKENGRVRLPYYTFSFETISGFPYGIPDLIMKCQKDINGYEAMKAHVFKNTPFAGKDHYHPEYYGNDEAQKAKLMDNDPMKPNFKDKNAPTNAKLFEHTPAPTLNPQIFGDQVFKTEQIKSIARINEALMGQFGKSDESGILHNRKVEEGLNINGITISNFHEIQRDIWKGWLQLALQVYKGQTDAEKIANIDRKFRSPKGNSVTLNEFKGLDNKNQPILGNDLSKVNYTHIITTLDTNNTSHKARKREINYTLMNTTADNEYNQIHKILLMNNFIEHLDDITPEQLEQLKQATELSLKLATNTLTVGSRELELRLATIEAQFGQLGMQQQMGELMPEGNQNKGQQKNNKQLPSPMGGGEER
ncbi:MAG: hypothetical protein ACTSYW_00405 [Candidatus Heimdallarchaeota archaeon]